MAGYQIQVRSCSDSTQEVRVLLFDECECTVGGLDALNRDHARMVARDLMALVRHRDPSSSFVLDTHIGSHAA